MKQTVGIIAAVFVALITILLILQLWGVIHIGFLTTLKSGVTLIILGGAAIAFVAVYAMFFWKGNELSLREQRELKKKQEQQGNDQENNSAGRISDK
jgi:type VI protein secretion system component VasK